ncbi:hypothetical protein MRX96_052438 [Rhipicephalus microplus]
MERSGDVSRHSPCLILVYDVGSLSRTKPSSSISSASFFLLGESVPYPHCVCGALKCPQISRGLEAAFAIASRKRAPKLRARPLFERGLYPLSTNRPVLRFPMQGMTSISVGGVDIAASVEDGRCAPFRFVVALSLLLQLRRSAFQIFDALIHRGKFVIDHGILCVAFGVSSTE